jgi:serine/threonine protein kinase
VHYDEEMALKILNEADRRAFVAEARVLRRLKHPHIVRVEDADFLEDGRPFLAMEFIDGEDLAARLLRTGPMRPEEALRIAEEACSGLAAAHGAGMIHRDIKPKNLLIARAEAEGIKLIDFGIAKVRKDAGIGFTGVQQGTTGFFLGTPRYASPEQALVGPLDGRTDIYSMGLVLYEMLTGRPPSGGDSDEAILENRPRLCPPPPHRFRPDLPLPVSSVVMRALEPDRTARYQTAGEMQGACESLRAALAPEETRRTRTDAHHAPAPTAEANASSGFDNARRSVLDPSAGTAGQIGAPVVRPIRARAVLVLVLAVAALIAWRLVTERGSPSQSRTSDQTVARRSERGKPPAPKREDGEAGDGTLHERGPFRPSPGETQPFFMVRLVTAEDLKGKSAWDLELMRNEIYARHGLTFRRPELQQYFASKSWYAPRYASGSFPASLLTVVQQSNVLTMLRCQKAVGR